MTTYDVVAGTLRRRITNTLEDSGSELSQLNCKMYMKASIDNESLSIDSGLYEIPSIMSDSARRYPVKALYMPIEVFDTTFPLKSAVSLMGMFSRITDEWFRIVEVKDYKYYVGKGVILYDDYLPMFSYNLVLEKNSDSLFTVYQSVKAVTLKVNKCIYEREDPISKFVKNQLIPKTLEAEDYYIGCAQRQINHVDVAICHDPNYILRIYAPMVPTTNNNLLGINAFLERNIEKLKI